jgi:single-strand selective monofunctional uracil DNA glycosylase
MGLNTIIDDLLEDLRPLRFTPPVAYVYNPLEYAKEAYELYLRLYANGPKDIVLLGMNPGPWGMAQTGVPFGEVTAVRDWLGIEAYIGQPGSIHPKRPVEGFACSRSEVSGKRLWGWARDTFNTPERFFSRFFVANYCPLLAAELKPLLSACDRALRRTIERIKPRYVVGIGQFAANRARDVLSGRDVTIGQITHPSPANPRANRGWNSLIMQELSGLGIQI